MTLRQEANGLLYNVPNNQLQYVIDILKTLIPPVNSVKESVNNIEINETDVSKRIGAGAGIINDPEGFDAMDNDVLNYFEEAEII